ncbi:MAG: hypothetical protein HYZ31_05400 [Gammaproteobacteria bacterium]|nr:hypothetical protein [Gammaproteobacteria bacterium]
MSNTRRNQEGAALLVGLIVLLIMTLLGVTSMSVTTTELKIANNLQTNNIAWQAAETVISRVAQSEPDAGVEPDISALNWGAAGTQSLAGILNESITSGTVDADSDLIYMDCMNTPAGYDITGSDQEGGSSAYKGLVHDINVNVTIVGSNGESIGQAQSRLNGFQTIRPGCP